MLSLPKVIHASQRSGKRFIIAVLSVLLASGAFWLDQQHAAAVRFLNRSLYINSSVPSESTFYRVSFVYPTNTPVGSVKMLFCTDPIPYLACDAPSGLDVSAAVLSAQTGATGYTLSQQTTNSIIISRPPINPPGGLPQSTYTFDNITNPDTPQNFYIRLTSHASTDGTGSIIDFGSIASATARELSFQTQVPPILIFCTGKQIPPDFDCGEAVPAGVDEYEDPSPDEVMYDTVEMTAYTNARNGYAITYAGRGLTSGIYELPVIEGAAEASIPGKGQFGINLAVNTDPPIGAVPIGPATNAYVNPDYTDPNLFQFNPGDTLVTSDFVTLNRKFTVSYILNIPPDTHPGIYSTTVTFICTGNF